MTEPDRAPVFISHAHGDVALARQVKASLEARGHVCWLAPDDMVGHEPWAAELLRMIERARALVVVVSTDSLASQHVLREVTLAVDRLETVIPVLLGTVVPSGHLEYLLSGRHWVRVDGTLASDEVSAIIRCLPPDRAGEEHAGRTAKPGRVSWDESRVPVPLDPIIGREQLIGSVVDAFGAGQRLVTLRGPGGVGKTRVALAVAQEVVDLAVSSVVFCDLSDATDEGELMAGLSAALGYSGADPDDPVAVAASLPPGPRLVICDNLEQVAAHCAPLQHLLRSAPQLRCLVTSRIRLGLQGEHVVVVPPLELPSGNDGDEVREAAAVQLFFQAARHVNPGFAPGPGDLVQVGRLCHALDGVPLALELAAARLGMMSPAQLVERVGTVMVEGRPTHGSSDRHSSVEATIAWSLSLLSGPALSGFTRLGIFQGGFTLEAAEEICAVEGESAGRVDAWLAELVDASLVHTADTPAGRRFYLLQMLQAEARRQCTDEDLPRRHAVWLARLGERPPSEYTGPAGARLTRTLAEELPNWAQALQWAAWHDPHLYVRLARNWRPVWAITSRSPDILIHPLPEPAWATLSDSDRATLGVLRAIALYHSATPGYRASLEEAVRDVDAIESDPDVLVLAWCFLAAARLQAGDRDAARDAASTAREVAAGSGDEHCESVAQDVSAFVAIDRGELVEARAFIERSLLLTERAGDHLGTCFGLSTLGSLLVDEGDADGAHGCADRLLQLVEEGHGTALNESQGIRIHGLAALQAGDLVGAAGWLLRSLPRDDWIPLNVIGDLLTAAAVLAAAGDLDQARRTLTVARLRAAEHESTIDVLPLPVRHHLAGLTDTPEATGAPSPVDGAVIVPGFVLAALRNVVGDPARDS